ncbi:hypothetical protein [Haloarcula litorea]|uniref:hypothetical protein n=1 Tax=Haloarcula litorea TaxID=3032579 RepID=UPI0023E81538|nr:hypothetical protein [Halomicroarcula sp. GDY20]
MPAKTGGSHALASFVTLVVGTVLSKYIWAVSPDLKAASTAATVTAERVAGVSFPYSDQFAGVVVLMVGISFVWGVLYHVTRHE